jgi:hypothetical protein
VKFGLNVLELGFWGRKISGFIQKCTVSSCNL